ncbi:hypothetical protein FQA39_LY18201 [Lamprigera yunnana]|nr:hypothetical protein FQA39_LY18201 [Lamprigera yunnana]
MDMEDSSNRETVQQTKLIKELQAHNSILSIEIENLKRRKSPLLVKYSNNNNEDYCPRTMEKETQTTALLTIEQQPDFYIEAKCDRLISEVINPEEASIRNSDEDKLPRNNKSLFEELHANTPCIENIKVNTLKTVPRVTNIQIKQQILILGDNQARDMAMLLKSLLISSKYNVLSIIKPNALLDDVVADVQILTKDFSL